MCFRVGEPIHFPMPALIPTEIHSDEGTECPQARAVFRLQACVPPTLSSCVPRGGAFVV